MMKKSAAGSPVTCRYRSVGPVLNCWPICLPDVSTVQASSTG